MTWTRFMDMHSGGGRKLDWDYIYIEAPEDQAKSIFYSRFNRNPERVTCTCCGEDYSISEEESLRQATAHERGCIFVESEDGKDGMYIEKGEKPPEGYKPSRWGSSWRDHVSLEDYLPTVKVIYEPEILDKEKSTRVPEEGYVWT